MIRKIKSHLMLSVYLVTIMSMLLVGCNSENGPLDTQISPNITPSISTNSNLKIIEPKTIYVFSQSDLKLMYVMFYNGQIGPIFPPKELQEIVWSNGSKVSMDMLRYIPDDEKALDKELIQGIIDFESHGHMDIIDKISGYELKSFDTSQIPQFQRQSGSVQRWVPENGQWANWEEPTVVTE